VALPADTAVPLAAAARELRVSPATLRRWLRAGAPAMQPGSVGRGHGAMVCLADVQRWRRAQVAPAADPTDDVLLDRVARALHDVFARDAGRGFPAHRELELRDRQAAALLVVAYHRLHRELTGRDADMLPFEIEHLWTISVT